MKQILFILSFCSTLSVFGQYGSIRGIITQSDSINGVAGVYVYLANTTIYDITKSDGVYYLSKIPYGTYTLEVSSVSHKNYSQVVTIDSSHEIIITVALPPSSINIDNVYIVPKGRSGIQEIPGSIQQLSSLELQVFSYTDVNRALRSVPGISIQEEDGFGLRTNIGLRGTGVERSQKITVMEDGVLIAPAPYSAPAAYYFPTFGRMEGIEVFKGGSQIMYGPYTSGGAINLISTQIPQDLTAHIRLSGGSFGTKTTHASVGDYFKNSAYLVETFQYSADGFKTLDMGEGIGFDKQDYLGKFQLHTNGTSKIYQSLTLKLGVAREVSDESYLGLTNQDFAITPFRMYAGAQKDVLTTSQNKQMLTHKIQPRRNISITTTAYQTEFSRNWYKLDAVKDSSGAKHKIDKILDAPFEYADAFSVLSGAANSAQQDALFVKANNRSYTTQGIQSTATFLLSGTDSRKQSIQLGLRYHVDNMDRFQWEDTYAMQDGVMQLTNSGVPGTESNRVAEASAFAGFAQYTLLYNKFLLKPGIRYEHITMTQHDYGKQDPERIGTNLKKSENHIQVFIPGFAAQYTLSHKTNMFAGIHKGFSPPGAQQNSKPEESINYELGFRYFTHANYLNAVVFYNDYSNLLGSDLAAVGGQGLGEMHNAGAVGTIGLELEAKYDVLQLIEQNTWMLPIHIAYTYSHAEFKTSFASTFGEWGTVEKGDAYPYMSTHQLYVGISLEHKTVSFTLSGKYTGSMRTSPGKGTPDEEQLIPSHLIVDASAQYTIKPNISIFSSITNLTNQTYIVARRPSGVRPGMPLATNIGIRARI